MHMMLQEAAKWCHGQLLGKPESADIRGFCIDSRAVQTGDLFVALPGERVDGHQFLAKAHEAGAVAAMVATHTGVNMPQIVVDNPLLALAELATNAAAGIDNKRVGITGSNGKTTVKMLVHSILRTLAKTHVSAGNHNNEIGLPLSLLAMPEDAVYGIFEMGAGKPGDIAYLANIAKPQVGVITTIAPAHLERMHSLQGIAETKGALYSALPEEGTAVINADSEFSNYFHALAQHCHRLTFGIEHPADVYATDIKLEANASQFSLCTPHSQINVRLPLAGRHNIANALAASSVALALDVPVDMIARGLATADSVPGRFHVELMPSGWTLIDDSYNANPASVAAAIDTLMLIRGEHWLVLGDMAELGDEAEGLHARVGAIAKRRGIDCLFTVGRYAKHASDAFGEGARHYSNHQALTRDLHAKLHADVCLVVKGSRSAAMEKVADGLKAMDKGEPHHVI